jgi:hypothetical protein
MQEAYHWIITYQDGDTYEETPDRGWYSAPTKPIATVALISNELAQRCLVLEVPEHATPICFRRRGVTISLSGQPTAYTTLTCIGWPGNYHWFEDDNPYTSQITETTDLEA